MYATRITHLTINLHSGTSILKNDIILLGVSGRKPKMNHLYNLQRLLLIYSNLDHFINVMVQGEKTLKVKILLYWQQMTLNVDRLCRSWLSLFPFNLFLHRKVEYSGNGCQFLNTDGITG